MYKNSPNNKKAIGNLQYLRRNAKQDNSPQKILDAYDIATKSIKIIENIKDMKMVYPDDKSLKKILEMIEEGGL